MRRSAIFTPTSGDSICGDLEAVDGVLRFVARDGSEFSINDLMEGEVGILLDRSAKEAPAVPLQLRELCRQFGIRAEFTTLKST